MTRQKTGMDRLKKAAAVLLVLALVLCCAACGSGDKESSAGESSLPEASSSPEAVGTPVPETVTVKIATITDISGSLNIRSEPNTDCDILTTAKAGEQFEVLTENCQQGWHEIAYEGGKAYVSSEFVVVSTQQQAAPTPTPDPDAAIIVNGSGRQESSASGEDGMTVNSIQETEDPARR